MFNSKKTIALLASLPIATFSLWSGAALGETLRTKTFDILITRDCEEGNVTCNSVLYYGKNIKTGAEIRLKGKTIHAKCADGVTPCRFLGYEFRNNQFLYRVTADGKLQVYRGKKLILQEKGTLAS
jgi:hypothetical protein